MRPIVFDFADWLNNICTEKALPCVVLDFTDAEETNTVLIQTSAPVVEKEYINGGKIFRMEFDLIMQGTVENKLNLKTYITDLCMFLTDLRDVQISEERKILRATSTAPSIRNITNGLICQYGISGSLTYKEN